MSDSHLLLRSVRLERFKAAFKPGSISLDPFNVIIGRNGSGKSTLLEALQWIATTIRRDAREASDRYYGVKDLINYRTQARQPYFIIELEWVFKQKQSSTVTYRIKVGESQGVPSILEEWLSTSNGADHVALITTSESGARIVHPHGSSAPLRVVMHEPDRLALGLVSQVSEIGSTGLGKTLQEFWSRAVFLRLSPNRLSQGSAAQRKSFEPLLDEEGQALPALLNELDSKRRQLLIRSMQAVMPSIRGVTVSKAELGKDARVNYSLLERMPYRGRSGKYEKPIPSWMLSEGTRRITAILALVVREPAPSFLAIEEIENGLDPWTIRGVLEQLQSAARGPTQVLLSTHSPWLLDMVPITCITQVIRNEGDTNYYRFCERKEIAAFDPNVPAGTRYVNEAE